MVLIIVLAGLKAPDLTVLGVGAALRTERGLAGHLVLPHMIRIDPRPFSYRDAGKTKLLREASCEKK